MRNRANSGTLAFCLFTLVLFGCAQTQEAARTRTGQGAAIGAATGALAGAVIGHQSGHRGAGAVIGGLAGAAVGGAVGYSLDKQAKELAKIPNAKVEKKDDRVIVTMSDKVLFDENSSVLRAGSQKALGQMADVFARYPDCRIIISGHTDNNGSEQYNQTLSERRARSVKNFLILKGVPEDRMEAIGFGEGMPIASNQSRQGRERNRRVEIELRAGSQPT